MNGFWDHKIKPSMFVVADNGKEVYRGSFKEGYKLMNEQRSLPIMDQRIEEQFGKIIKKFPILHHGWDGDGYGYVVGNVEHKYSNEESYLGPFCKYKLILTNHSKPYEADVSELRQKVIEYQQMIGETSEAINILQ